MRLKKFVMAPVKMHHAAGMNFNFCLNETKSFLSYLLQCLCSLLYSNFFKWFEISKSDK
jgi:hypothetical protein